MTQVVLFNVFNGLIVGAFYALMALGLKGGFALAQSGLTAQVATGLGLHAARMFSPKA